MNTTTASPTDESTEAKDAVRGLGGILASWMVSLVTHLFALLTLAILTFSPNLDLRGVLSISASVAPTEPQLVFEVSDSAAAAGQLSALSDSLLLESVELPNENLLLEETLEVEPNLDLASALEAVPTSALDALQAATKGNQGNATGIGVGMTSVFGVRTTGKRFVYVVDNSNSMTQGRLEAAIQEIQDSVDMLKPDQLFYIIFYSDTAYPQFHPKPSKTFVSATDENKQRLREWLATVEHCLHTRGEEAMKLAMDLKPDVIYLMGDGAFTDRTVEQTLARNDKRVLIHTFGFDMKREQDRSGLKAIAEKFRGDFHDAQVAPEFMAIERKNKRPRNHTMHGFWGITLPADKKGS